MDIYRFFHPHHNPRLHGRGIRHHELGELEQTALELLRATERAQKRVARAGPDPIAADSFTSLIDEIKQVVLHYRLLLEAHPGDSQEESLDLIGERSVYTGWEVWTSLMSDQVRRTWDEGEQVVEPSKIVANG